MLRIVVEHLANNACEIISLKNVPFLALPILDMKVNCDSMEKPSIDLIGHHRFE
jgi:hypothetical protein